MSNKGKNNSVGDIILQGSFAIAAAFLAAVVAGLFVGSQTRNTLDQQHEEFLASQTQQLEIFREQNNVQICLMAASYISISDAPEAREFGYTLMETACQNLLPDELQVELDSDTRDQIISGELDFQLRHDPETDKGELWLVPRDPVSSLRDRFVAPLELEFELVTP